VQTYGERAPNDAETMRRIMDRVKNDIRVALPGIVVSFDATEQTATIQPAVRERERDAQGNLTWATLPLLVDVPVLFPRAGGFAATFPIQEGDEVLVVFADMSFDAAWDLGGVQNQVDIRRHDLSDGFAIPAYWSKPKALANFNTSAAEIRTEDGTTKITLSQTEGVTITSTAPVTVTASSVTLGPATTIDGRVFLDHTHSDPQGGTTGPVT